MRYIKWIKELKDEADGIGDLVRKFIMDRNAPRPATKALRNILPVNGLVEMSLTHWNGRGSVESRNYFAASLVLKV